MARKMSKKDRVNCVEYIDKNWGCCYTDKSTSWIEADIKVGRYIVEVLPDTETLVTIWTRDNDRIAEWRVERTFGLSDTIQDAIDKCKALA